MKKITVLATTLLIFNSPLSAEQYNGNLSLLIGQKSFNSNDWPNVDNQMTLGFMADFKNTSWPVSIVLDGFLSAGDDPSSTSDAVDITPGLDASSTSLHIGVRKAWEHADSDFDPYIGGGATYVSGSQESTFSGVLQDESDTGIGGWIGAGIFWKPSKRLHVGLDVRFSQAAIQLFDNDIDAGGLQRGLFLGYHW